MEYIIYKIVCKDTNITDFYIGSTKDFNKRQINHKSACNSSNNKYYNLKVYQVIRDNGGFENWDFIELEKIDKENRFIRERYWIEKLKATLNAVIQSRTKKEYKQYWINSFDYSNHRKNGDKIYREKNKDKLKKTASEKLLCECGCEYTRRHKARHEKSKKHLTYLSCHQEQDEGHTDIVQLADEQQGTHQNSYDISSQVELHNL